MATSCDLHTDILVTKTNFLVSHCGRSKCHVTVMIGHIKLTEEPAHSSLLLTLFPRA